MRADRAFAPHDASEQQREKRGRVGSAVRARVLVVADETISERSDRLAAEEPLEIRVRSAGEARTTAVTMRTPGNDFELVAGWLCSEGVAAGRSDIARMAYCIDRSRGEEQLYNIINVDLGPEVSADLSFLERSFFTTSACGVCGKAGLEQLQTRGCLPLTGGPEIDPEVIYSLPDKLKESQRVFEETGGLHAAALFDSSGELVALREDVGRHNALDKLVGWALLGGSLPLEDHLVVVSGRASFELVQKCVRAGVPALCAISAPSSLAVELARHFGVTLIGFLRARRFNIYSCPQRVNGS